MMVAKLLQQLKQRFRKELGPDDYTRFVHKADAAVRELSTKPRSSKRLNRVIAELLGEFVARSSENAVE
jgi:hypothetical protein